jgi:hypothetical protein
LKPILLEDHLSLGLFTLGCVVVISRNSCLKWQFDSLSSSHEAGGEASWLLIAPLVFFLVIAYRWRQR